MNGENPSDADMAEALVGLGIAFLLKYTLPEASCVSCRATMYLGPRGMEGHDCDEKAVTLLDILVERRRRRRELEDQEAGEYDGRHVH